MPLGKGLSSLIPDKNVANQNLNTAEEKHNIQNNLSLGQSANDNQQNIKTNDEDVFINEITYQHKSFKKDNEAVFQIEVTKIKSNPFQPRKNFDSKELEELAQSIREHGILQPLLVTKIETDTEKGTSVEYQLIVGERRLMAAKMIGLKTVPVIIKKINEPKTKLELALIENIQRHNLSPIELAKAYAQLQEQFGLTQREIALRVGRSREAVANTLRLLSLPPEIQLALNNGSISEFQARQILSLNDYQKQLIVFQSIINQKQKINNKQKSHKINEDKYWSKKIEEKFGLPSKVIRTNNGGKIILNFYSQEELENFLNSFNND
ncbi:MAG: ParB/RepB/Spo0J family partition protein [Minisyncoccia bacterium]